MFKFHSFTGSCPVFLAPLIEDTVFSPLYIIASFVKRKLPIHVWVYLWAFYLVPLAYISVFVPVPYCLDACNFVAKRKPFTGHWGCLEEGGAWGKAALEPAECGEGRGVTRGSQVVVDSSAQ